MHTFKVAVASGKLHERMSFENIRQSDIKEVAVKLHKSKS
jgi:hypothetical protein